MNAKNGLRYGFLIAALFAAILVWLAVYRAMAPKPPQLTPEPTTEETITNAVPTTPTTLPAVLITEAVALVEEEKVASPTVSATGYTLIVGVNPRLNNDQVFQPPTNSVAVAR